MFSPSSKSTSASKSFLWTFPECPVRIQVHYHFIDRLQKEVLDQAPADLEVGGLLIGSELSPSGDIEICDHFSLAPRSESEKHFIICSDSLTKAIQSSRAPDRRVVGCYRTHLEQRIELRAEDQECIRSKFNNPMNVFLVLRPRDGRASGKFFFWQDGSVVGGLTFPFSSTELKTPTWTTVVGGTPKESRLDILLSRARALALRVSTGMRTGFAYTQVRVAGLTLLVILIALAAALRFYHPSARTSFSLGLRVERALLGIVVAWNPTSPEVATAKDADLIVWDGSSTPTFVRLTPAQLLVGRTFFTTVSNRVEVRLDVIGAAGRARTESMVLVNRAPDLDPSPTLAIGPTKQAQALEDANASPPAAPLAPPALVKPAAPAAPAPKADNRLAELSKRPEAQSANGGPMAVLTQRFHEFNNSSAGVPRKAPDKTGPGREAERQQPAADTQPVKPAPLVTEEVSLGAFQAAVPIRERRPEIRSDLRTLIQSDNVVEVQVRINASGKVTAAKLGAMNGPLADVLAKPAVKAAMGWRFRPATENGEAVPSDKILEFLFRPSTR